MRILLLQTGSTLQSIRRLQGDFDRLFARHLPEGLQLDVIDVRHDTPPDPGERQGVILSGSPAMVTDEAPWSLAVESWIRRHVDRLPMLGVCYGHQLLARALGGEVADNPNGRQIGTRWVQRQPVNDPLFGPLPLRFVAQTTHVQSVLRLPDGAVRLARTELDPNHAFRWGSHTWGVQFHPEFDAHITRAYLRHRRAELLREGLDVQDLLAGCRPSPVATRVLTRFCRQVRSC